MTRFIGFSTLPCAGMTRGCKDALCAADALRLSHKFISTVSSGPADAKRRCDPTIRQRITGRSLSGFAGSRPARTSRNSTCGTASPGLFRG
jgi:hypothetical protein